MKAFNDSYSNFSGLGRYRIRTILIIALSWTVIDIIVTLISENPHVFNPVKSLTLREVFVFFMSGIMGYLFVFTLKDVFRQNSLWINFLFKSVVLLLAAFAMNFLVHYVENRLVLGLTNEESLQAFAQETLHKKNLVQKILYWLVLFVMTQLYIEVNEKYSPGVFMDILRGKYINPRVEKRIVMFLDLKDSTPIAEKLGHKEYFLFIREFIFHVSMALIENDGRIYQYVGDEIVVSWLSGRRNTRKCIASVIEARKNLQKNGEHFRRHYGAIPEFRVGIHMGDVTVGEIGVIKKDLAMSGDTMNTTARIRSACNELNEKFIVSKDFIESSRFKSWQSKSLGIVDLKGKSDGIELYALQI